MWERLIAFLNLRILTIGDTSISLGGLVYFASVVLALVFVSNRLKKTLVRTVLARTSMDLGSRQAVGTIFQYSAILLGLLIIVQTAGIDLTTLNVVAGALGVGLGFGLQNVASNFISGLIILFERPIKLGDRIVVGDIEGDVVEIRARSTTVLTNDNIAIIVPNSKFISENVINWSYNDTTVRFSIPVGVAYGVDVRLVESLLLKIAAEHPEVLKEPIPAVRFMSFGDSALLFELRVWSSALMHRKGKLTSDLNFAIHDAFDRHNVTIPFPQRDLHVGGALDIHLTRKVPDAR
jgi:small-conductance mechanosensitive channel